MTPATPLRMVEQRDGPDGYQVRLIGEIDLSSLSGVQGRLDAILAAAPARVAFDLSEVSFMDSSGISLLLEFAHRVPEMVLDNPSPAVSRLIELCGLAPILPMVTPLPVTS